MEVDFESTTVRGLMPNSPDPTIVVVLSKTFPVPPGAGTPRPFHLLTRLATHARLLCVAGVTESEVEWSTFAGTPAIAATFESSRVRLGQSRQPRFALPRMLLTGRARHDLQFRDPERLGDMQALISQIIREEGPLRLLCIGMASLQFVPHSLWGSCIVDAVDAESLMIERLARGGAGLSLSRRLKFMAGLPALRRLEGRIFERVSAVTYNSSADIAHLRLRYPRAPMVRVIDGCDTAYFSPEHTADVQEEPDAIVFNGQMDYAPNVDAACHLVNDIMPLVWQRRPETRVFLVGPDPEGALDRLRTHERVVVTGLVDDVRPYLARSAVVVSPLRFGTGMKNKLQAGLAMKKAMVVSSITCEGFDGLEPGVHALVADDPAEFASDVCALLEDPERRTRMAEAGQRFIRDHFSWESAFETLWTTLEACPAALPTTS